MKLQELLNTKLIWENVVVVDLDHRDTYGEGAKANALRVFNRPVEVSDFKADKYHGCEVSDCLGKHVVAVFGSKDKYKTVIQVSTNASVKEKN